MSPIHGPYQPLGGLRVRVSSPVGGLTPSPPDINFAAASGIAIAAGVAPALAFELKLTTALFPAGGVYPSAGLFPGSGGSLATATGGDASVRPSRA